jgi:hypothetical protein
MSDSLCVRRSSLSTKQAMAGTRQSSRNLVPSCQPAPVIPMGSPLYFNDSRALLPSYPTHFRGYSVSQGSEHLIDSLHYWEPMQISAEKSEHVKQSRDMFFFCLFPPLPILPANLNCPRCHPPTRSSLQR